MPWRSPSRAARRWSGPGRIRPADCARASRSAAACRPAQEACRLDRGSCNGQQLTLQELVGTKRAAYHLYTRAPIGARQALDLGLVNEVLPGDELLPRAWEIARAIMTSPRTARRLTHAIAARPWKRRLVHDLGFGLAHEMFGISSDRAQG